ncbi:hypothetical protein FH712_09950 [Marinobacter nauticus]|uniref:HEPN domain-containing protein n=1 Tax=Marinobacter nauticus TaxID=2743 RepID=UPI00112F86DC|nr:HEPN domain-containing protein [Marinobacter nauticus]TPW24230.1 hypothetical protein FH712_09950 [Marinobacter nauticus]
MTIQRGCIISSEIIRDLSCVDRVFPTRGAVADKIEKYIGSEPSVKFFYSRVMEWLYDDVGYVESKPDFNLVESGIIGSEEEIVDRLIRDFQSLPYSYCFSLPLHDDLFHVFDKNVEFVPGVSVSRFDELYRQAFPDKVAGLGLMGIGSFVNDKWKENAKVLQFNFEGFVSGFLDTRPYEEAINELRSFFGICIGLGLVSVNASRSDVNPSFSFDVHVSSGEIWLPVRSHALDNEDLALIMRLTDDGDRWDQAVRDGMSGYYKDQIAYFYGASQSSEMYQRIKLSSIWLYNSYKSIDPMMSVVQATVAAEILLGDKGESDIIGINKLLSNRCAYLIGESESDRAKIIKDFKSAYDLRSKIVHSGKNFISSDETRVLYNLWGILVKVIQKEIRMLPQKEDS